MPDLGFQVLAFAFFCFSDFIIVLDVLSLDLLCVSDVLFHVLPLGLLFACRFESRICCYCYYYHYYYY